MSLSPELLEKLRCPACAPQGEDAGRLELVKEVWLVCQSCGRKYPVQDDIPVMLVEEGDRWQNTPVDALPETPPKPVV